jgi:hypothetical protein
MSQRGRTSQIYIYATEEKITEVDNTTGHTKYLSYAVSLTMHISS